MTRKITIQHLYTTSGTTAPNDLINGEIAISHNPENEAIFIKPRQEAGKPQEEIKFIPEVRIRKMFEEAGIGSNDVITGLSNQLSTHIAVSGDTDILGHVYLVSGDVENIKEYKVGEAASSYHTHGQYLEESLLSTDKGFQKIPGYDNNPGSYGVKAGTGITVDSKGVSISEEYQTKITNGATAYGWGDHKTEGYAKNSDLTTLRNSVTAHTGNTTVHITGEERTNWNNAANRINTFLDVETGATEALDSLYEIQEYLTGSGNSVNTLLESLNNLTDKVSGNTDDITSLKYEFGDEGRVTLLEKDVLRRVETIEAEGNLSVTPGVTDNGDKKYTISHTPASTQASAITVNSNEVISFGSTFDIVNKIAYDANGHVVSGSTQTLTLPNLLTATTDNYGVVKIKDGQLTLVEELANTDYSKTAAGVAHGHTEYVKLTDLYSGNTSSNITISCGTY